MTTLRPTSIDGVQEAVRAHPRLALRSGGTKPGLSGGRADRPVLELSGLDALVEYTPEECTFTAEAGVRLSTLEHMLSQHGQYLPFDPPLVEAGATLGGTVASGVNGSGRYRHGGVRDFVIGARIVDGAGRAVRSGGKVVKNAAGFLLHQAVVGSCGTLGVIAELTCKVFPRPEARATIRTDARDLPSALELMRRLEGSRLDLEALDLEPPGVVWVRVGTFCEALNFRIATITGAIGAGAEVRRGEDDAARWRESREYAWLPEGRALVRVPVTPTRLESLDRVLEWHDAVRRYVVAGNLALVGWNGSLDSLSEVLRGLDLVGQVLIGPAGQAFIGAVQPNAFEDRLRRVMDPDGRFAV